MEVNDVKEITISDFFNMCENEDGKYQIDTPDGWQDINFLVKKKNKESYNLITEKGRELGCSREHRVLTKEGWKKSQDIDVQSDFLLTRDGEEGIVAKEFIGVKDTFDLGINSEQHRYYSNDIISHNCGKSLVCKAIAGTWEMPLLRLDFGKLFDSLIGKSEERARSALKLAEVVAPCILWIDEIEKGLSGVQSSGRSDGGTTSRVLSTFLTWMQEKTAPVFVVATANDHASIPHEFLRAGRFDEIFFVGLPNETERKDILSVLLKRKGFKVKDFNIDLIASENNTNNYSGAELEKGIENAMLVGFADKKRKIDEEDIIKALRGFKPLFKIREEDFDDLKEWVDRTQCLRANLDEVKKVELGLKSKKTLDLE